MSPHTTRRVFYAFVTALSVLILFGVAYLVAAIFSDTSTTSSYIEDNYSCAKIGIHCDTVVVPRTPSALNIFLAGLIEGTWFNHIAATALFMLVGLVAYWIRCRAQLFYGCIEIFAALTFAAGGLYSINVQNFRLFSAAIGLLAALRHRRFFSLPEINAAIRELVSQLNARVTRHLGTSRSCVVR
jgi:hypothetical protein